MASPRLASIYLQEQIFGHGVSLPDCCLIIRAAINGSYDPWQDDDIDDAVYMLKKRIETWEPTLRPEDERMDTAVRELVLATIEYVEERKL
jgi:hypothetical protein